MGGDRVRSALRLGRFAREPLGPQPFLIGVKRLLGLFVIAHGLFGLDPACGITSLALLRGQGFASEGKVFGHAETTRRQRNGSMS